MKILSLGSPHGGKSENSLAWEAPTGGESENSLAWEASTGGKSENSRLGSLYHYKNTVKSNVLEGFTAFMAKNV